MKLDAPTSLALMSKSLISVLEEPPEDVPIPVLGGLVCLVIESYIKGITRKNPNVHRSLILGELLTLMVRKQED